MIRQEEALGTPATSISRKNSWFVSLTSFCFVLLQSACTAVMAISGLRLLIGVGSLAAAASGVKFLIAIHSDAIRIPMLFVAVVGSLLNLFVIWRIRSLRARPSSSWRVAPITPEVKRAERIQILIAALSLVLACVESAIHIHLHGTV